MWMQKQITPFARVKLKKVILGEESAKVIFCAVSGIDFTKDDWIAVAFPWVGYTG